METFDARRVSQPRTVALQRLRKTPIFQVLVHCKYSAFASVASLAMMMITGRAPANVSRCSVKRDTLGNVVAQVYLQNQSSKHRAKIRLLADVKTVERRGGNRLFELETNLAPDQGGVFEGRSIDSNNTWRFKKDGDAREGCELDTVIFHDGSNWELGVPWL